MTITTPLAQPQGSHTLNTNIKGNGTMRQQMTTILGGALILSLSLAPMAVAKLSQNGPDLTGTRINMVGGNHSQVTPTPTGGGAGGSPKYWATPVTAPMPPQAANDDDDFGAATFNGPDLTGTRVHADGEPTPQIDHPVLQYQYFNLNAVGGNPSQVTPSPTGGGAGGNPK